jgi:tetratricopeptide (TPR) repeat protein
MKTHVVGLRRAWVAFLPALLCLALGAQLPEPVAVGRIADCQGLVSVRPANGERWTPVTEELLLAPGDWLRTDVRGANAVQVRLATGGSVILGPGSLVEFADSAILRVTRGELEDTGDKAHPLTVGLPGEKAGEVVSPVTCTGATVLRIMDGKLERLDREPIWLQGFKGTVVKESMGELLVKVDGRDVPLTVGYHKVTIDIRDQIARTVIEESFVNHTSTQLEGVFHFPLPADASISDFGMWIGEELVQADVVEKQRAREIYETILREQRDPGLLEWTAGNLFKARVFPIFPQAEKRVTITYTQVLPMRGGSYRYTYPLESEMLRQKPLRELQLVVNLYSTAPLTGVRCVSHPARLRQTANAATIEFAAQEYTPDRDFELVIEPDLEKQPLTVVPHQRGSDGYFLLLLSPPAERVGRRLLPGGEPLRLIVLADTSGSLDAGQRAVLAEFLRALLGSLGRRDRFTLAACDVECTWLTDGFRDTDEAEVGKALDALAARRSLGWSDLGKAFAAAAEAAAKADGPCQIVYLGDGIPATAETDPVAFAKRLPDLLKEALARGASCHAVATGSSYEAVVLKTLAAQGAGSFRRIESSPAKAARELLEELTRPPVRGLALGFKGLRAARVYPEELPNLPAGAQQVIVGRYQPASLAPDATVRVTGRVGEKEVAFEQPLRLPPGEEGNSFIPRLWARQHLDYLLAQGATPELRAEIVGFSQEYRIMTPYTSFLVLETDADRERFGVQRHVAMRDGEAFFAEGRTQANFQLVQQQMKQAAAWRAGLRRQVLAEMAQLGREPWWQSAPVPGGGRGGGMGGGGMVPLQMGGGGMGPFLGVMDYRAKAETAAMPVAAPDASWVRSAGGAAGDWTLDAWRDRDAIPNLHASISAGSGAAEPLDRFSRLAEPESALRKLNDELADSAPESPGLPSEADGKERLDLSALRDLTGLRSREEAFDGDGSDLGVKFSRVPPAVTAPASAAPARPASRRAYATLGEESVRWDWQEGAAYGGYTGGRSALRAGKPVYDARQGSWTAPDQWLSAWPPALPPGPPAKRRGLPRPEGWPEEALRLAEALDRRPALAATKATLRVTSTTRGFEPRRRGRLSSVSVYLALAGPERWLTLSAADSSLPALQWSTPEQVGALWLPNGLGRVAKRTDVLAPVCPLLQNDPLATSLAETYRSYRCRLETKGRDRVEMVLTPANRQDYSVNLLVDTERRVVLEQWVVSGGKEVSRTEYGRFREVAGVWWATRVTTKDGEGEVTSRSEIDVDLPDAGELANAWAVLDRVRADSILVPVPLPEVTEAKRAAAAGKATIEQRLALISHAAATQQWDRARPHLEALGKELAGKPGWRCLEFGFLAISRRHEELRLALLAATTDLVSRGLKPSPCLTLLPADRVPPRCGEFGLIQTFIGQRGHLQANERLELLDLAKPVYSRQPERLEAMVSWQQQRAESLRQAGQSDAALALEEELMRSRPWDASALTRYAQNLANRGDYEAAVALLERALKSPDKAWRDQAVSQVRETLLNTYENAGWYDRQIGLLAALFKEADTELTWNQCQRYLTALLRADREAEADTTATAWVEPLLIIRRQRPGLTPAELAKANAAAHYLVGDIRGYSYSDWLDEKWLETLAQVARGTAADPKTLDLARVAMDNHRFGRTDACRRLRAEFAQLLVGELTGRDVGVVQAWVNWISTNDPAVEADTWRSIAANLEQRWTAAVAALKLPATDPQRPSTEEVHRWGGVAASVYQGHVGPAEWLRFCRQQYQAACPLEGERPREPVPLEGERPREPLPLEGEGPRRPGAPEPPPAALDAYRDAYAAQWLSACLAQPWRREVETEAFGVLGKLALSADPTDRALTQAGALVALADWLVRGRQAVIVAGHTGTPPESAKTGPLDAPEVGRGRRYPTSPVLAPPGTPPAEGQPSVPLAEALLPGQAERLKVIPAKPLQDLTRTERRDLGTLALALSREACAARLAEETERQPEALRPWLAVERLALLARLASTTEAAREAALRPRSGPSARPPTPGAAREAARPPGDSLPELAAQALELLGPQPPPAFASAADEALFLRRLALAEYLVVLEATPPPTAKPAGKPGAKPVDTPALKALCTTMRAGLALPDEGPRGFWRGRFYRLLLALDRPADLETELRAWVAAGDRFGPWRVPLAYLLAETDRLPEAAAALAAVEADDELGPAEYRALADWYTALGDQEKQRDASRRELAATDEGTLGNRIEQGRQKLSRHQYAERDDVPADLDPAVIEVLAALLRKTEYPGNCVWQVCDLYRRTRDTRLLRCLAEGTIGHTAQQVYPLLQGFRDALREVQSEATLDELATAIQAVRGRVETLVDRRALLLLEAEVKRRASEVLNQPGQHLPAALGALQAGLAEAWSPGEPRLMADYLAALGKITQEALAQEQLRQAEALYQRPGESPEDRLAIACAYGRLLGSYGRTEAGIEVLVGALDEYRRTQGGHLNSTANQAADTLIGLCEQCRHFAQGETWLRAELTRPANGAQREWLVARLCRLYETAVGQDGETALGRGQEQYAAVNREIVAELTKPGRPQHLQELVSRYCGIARAAQGHKFKGVGGDLWTFAAQVVPEVLRRLSREPHGYQSAVGRVAEGLHDLATPRDAIAFLLACAETEPPWFRFDYNSFWQQHGNRLGQWRPEAKELGDLEPRLLAIVLRELRSDLERQQQRNRLIYGAHHSHFWSEKAADFAQVSEEVYAQRRDSGSAVVYIAEYLYFGLDRFDRAIAMLQEAWQRELLDENGQYRLVTCLQGRERYQDSVPVVEKLVRWRPDNPEYRRCQILAYAKSGQAERAETVRAEAERHLKEHGLWGEQAIAALAAGCLGGGLYGSAVTYFDEVIALHRRTAPPSARGDSALSQYYADLARAHAGLGDTANAVEAAAGAVVSWGRDLGNRRNATESLVQVLRDAKDLDGYVAGLDKQVAETRLDSPIVRKALGRVYAERQAHDKAAVQLRRALAGQPNDEDTHRALVASLDALRQPDEAVVQLLDLGGLLPRDLDLRREVCRRLKDLQKPAEAERAATALVEAQPNEAESHQAMATLRQEEDRWPEAIPHWRRVCELRELEPTGLLGLAQAEIHVGKAAEAKETLGQLLAKAWPQRFGDVHGQARTLLGQLER